MPPALCAPSPCCHPLPPRYGRRATARRTRTRLPRHSPSGTPTTRRLKPSFSQPPSHLDDGILLVDPIPLAPAALEELARASPASARIVRHQREPRARASHEFAAQFAAPISRPPRELPRAELRRFQPLVDAGDQAPAIIAGDRRSRARSGRDRAAIPVTTAAALIVGDALINFELARLYVSAAEILRRPRTDADVAAPTARVSTSSACSSRTALPIMSDARTTGAAAGSRSLIHEP